MYVYVLLVIALFTVGGFADTASKVNCIHNKFKNDVGTAGYTTCYDRSGALPIPKIKQCYQEVLKDKEIVKVASNGQMTVDGDKFAQEASTTSRTKVGAAMQACASRPNSSELYREAARAVQCVFEEVKKTCK